MLPFIKNALLLEQEQPINLLPFSGCYIIFGKSLYFGGVYQNGLDCLWCVDG